MKSWIWAMTAWLVICGIGRAASLQALTTQEKLATGADVVMVVDHTMLTSTVNAASQTVTFDVAAKQAVEFVALVLRTAFVDTATNAHNSTAVVIGDGNDDDRFLASTELNSNGTEVWLKFPRQSSEAASITLGSKTATVTTNVAITLQSKTGVTVTTNVSLTLNSTNYQVLVAGGGTQSLRVVSSGSLTVSRPLLTLVTNASLTVSRPSLVVVTNATVSTASSEYGRYAYMNADTVDIKFTPTAAYNLNQLDAGEVLFYFRILDQTKLKP